MKRTRKTSRGHTLVELVLYLTSAAVVMSVPLMIAVGAVRRHHATTVQTSAQGEARNVLDALGWDIRHATRVSQTSGGLPRLRLKQGGDTLEIRYRLDAEEPRPAPREGPDAALQTYALVRCESRVDRSRPSSERVIGRNLAEIELTSYGKESHSVIRCRVKLGDVSDGRRFLVEREALFSLRQAEEGTWEEGRE